MPVDTDATSLHAAEHRRHRTLQRFVDRHHPLGRQPRFQRFPQPKGDIRVFRRILRRLVDGDTRKANEGTSRAGDLSEGDRFVAEQLLAQHVHAVVRAAGVKHIGDQQRVVDRRDADAAAA